MFFVWLCVLTLAVMQLSVFFTTIYLHRSLTHRALDLHPAVAFLMHLHLLLFTGIAPREWVAVHRKHHAFSDKEGDPHSPYIYGLWSVLFGNYWLYRRETLNKATLNKYTRDYRPDILDRLPFASWGPALGLVLFMLAFGPLWGFVAMAFNVVSYILLNASINSICHMIGYRNHDNLATNVQTIALLTAGEGLHNNHHEFPASARLSWAKREFDPAWPVIRLLCGLRLAHLRTALAAKAA